MRKWKCSFQVPNFGLSLQRQKNDEKEFSIGERERERKREFRGVFISPSLSFFLFSRVWKLHYTFKSVATGKRIRIFFSSQRKRERKKERKHTHDKSKKEEWNKVFFRRSTFFSSCFSFYNKQILWPEVRKCFVVFFLFKNAREKKHTLPKKKRGREGWERWNKERKNKKKRKVEKKETREKAWFCFGLHSCWESQNSQWLNPQLVKGKRIRWKILREKEREKYLEETGTNPNRMLK